MLKKFDKEIGETQIVDVPGNVEVYIGTDYKVKMCVKIKHQ